MDKKVNETGFLFYGFKTIFYGLLILCLILGMSGCASADILIVNDDDGLYSSGDSSAMDFFNALSGTYAVTLWNQTVNGSPTVAELQGYDVVIWTTGDFWRYAVNATDAQLLRDYVANGTARLLLEGGDTAYEHRGAADPFMNEVPHSVLHRDFFNGRSSAQINR